MKPRSLTRWVVRAHKIRHNQPREYGIHAAARNLCALARVAGRADYSKPPTVPGSRASDQAVADLMSAGILDPVLPSARARQGDFQLSPLGESIVADRRRPRPFSSMASRYPHLTRSLGLQ